MAIPAIVHFSTERFSTMFYHDINGEPVDGLFADLLRPLLGELRRQPREYHPAMPRFQGRELPIDEQISAVVRRDERMTEINKPAPITMQTVVENVIDLVTLAGKARAKAFLWEQLRYSAMPATVIAERAMEAGITRTALRRGKKALRITSFKSGNAWFWQLPGSR
jgi:hypothetical protein